MEISLRGFIGFFLDSMLSAWWIWLIYGIHYANNKRKEKKVPKFRWYFLIGDVLGWLAAGMTHKEILSDFPELTEDDIFACLAYAADRESKAKVLA